jgi:hypothetical protein
VKINLGNSIEFDLFQIEESQKAKQLALRTNGVVYSWKTVGESNWLERGVSIADVLGLTILPKESPDWIDLPNDKEE